MIGHLESEPSARTFSDYLYAQGIKNQIEVETDGRWALWIHAEDQLDQARSLLRSYQANPGDPAVRRAAQNAEEVRAREKEDEEAAQKRVFDRDRLFPDRSLFGSGRLTLVLIVFSVVVYLLSSLPSTEWITQYLLISESFGTDLPEVHEGQVWRLLTPIFLHMSILHIVFNMLWLNDLGTMIESRQSTLRLALLVVVIGVVSNLGQYYMNGPRFGGMSGVVYGLLGYVWMKGKFDPGSGLFLHPSTVMMMFIWLVLGYTNVLPGMANTAHLAGLAAGVVWGFSAAQLRR
jgi:GlpG protein